MAHAQLTETDTYKRYLTVLQLLDQVKNFGHDMDAEPGGAPGLVGSEGTIGIGRSKRKPPIQQAPDRSLRKRRQQQNSGFYKDLHCGT